MAKTKTVEESTPAQSSHTKTRKTTAVKPMSPQQRAAAVEKNIGKSVPLRDFLASIGWR